MDNELDLGKYSSAIQRRRLVILAAVALGAIAGLAVGWRSPLSSNPSLVPINRSAELASAGISPENIDVGSILNRVASTLSSDEFDSELEPDSSVTAQAKITDNLNHIVLTVNGPSEAQIDRVLETVSRAAARSYADEMDIVLEGVTANTEVRLERRRAVLESIEQQLFAAGVDQRTLSEGLLVSAERTRAEVSELESVVAALQRLSTGLGGDLRLIEGADPARARPPIVLAVLGGVGAGLLACGIVALLAAFDRRIRTRRDLDRIGLTNLLGVLSKLETDTEMDVLAGALRQAATRASTAMIQLIPVTESAASARAARLSRGMQPVEVYDRPPIAVDVVETMRHASESLTVIMITWGKDDRITSMSVANRLAAASKAAIGVVLVEVPPDELAFIER